MIATIGYEKAELADFLATLTQAGISVLVDIRDRAQSRRPGFSKSAISRALEDAGIAYLHIPALGDPKAGREAARRGDFRTFRRIFGEVMASDSAIQAMANLIDLASVNTLCLMCYERDQAQCHRKIVSDHLCAAMNVRALHLGVRAGAGNDPGKRRVRHPHQGAATPVERVF